MNNRSSFNFSLIATTIAILFGLALHSLAVYLRDNGCIRRRAWLGVIVLPFAIFIGLFVIAGSF